MSDKEEWTETRSNKSRSSEREERLAEPPASIRFGCLDSRRDVSQHCIGQRTLGITHVAQVPSRERKSVK